MMKRKLPDDNDDDDKTPSGIGEGQQQCCSSSLSAEMVDPDDDVPLKSRCCTKSATTSRFFVVVRGIRYIRPYLKEQLYSVRVQNVGKTACVVLAEAYHRRANRIEDTISYFIREIHDGRVRLKRHKRCIDDDRPYIKDFQVLDDPHMVTEKGDRFQLVQHIHERCVLDRGPVPLPILASYPNYTVIFKPAGLPTLDEMGGRATVLGLMEDVTTGDGHKYHLGHRLDRPVSGLTILGRSKSSSARLTKAVAPEKKQQQQQHHHHHQLSSNKGGRTDSVLKAYIARVKGKFDPLDWGEVGPSVVYSVWLRWDNASKKALVVNRDDDMKYDASAEDGNNTPDQTIMTLDGIPKQQQQGRETITSVGLLKYDQHRDESVVRVELGTGARHQIRAVLAYYLKLPIVGDTQYGGPPFCERDWDDKEDVTKNDDDNQQQQQQNDTKEELLLFADDKDGSLLRMLQQEKKDWCDKCRWQIEETQNGGTVRGTDRLEDYICLLSYHYVIPDLGIDVCVPDNLVPKWAKVG